MSKLLMFMVEMIIDLKGMYVLIWNSFIFPKYQKKII